jgi:23S rRNA (adenine2503-C2)-methyltransferase
MSDHPSNQIRMGLTAEQAIREGRQWGATLPQAEAAYRALMREGQAGGGEAPGRIESRQEAEGVLKFVSALTDGARIETVVIGGRGRDTVCVSTQVGCRRACRFCATGRMGWTRDLAAAEIVWQVWAARFELGRAVRNVVFMGMGEPLDNVDALISAIAVLTDPRGLGVARGRITVSTAGQVAGLRRLAAAHPGNLGLAISLNAADDGLRNRLMPINREFPLSELKAALQAYPRGPRGVFFVEYVLLAGVNDAPADARRVVEFLEGLPARINLIAYNPGEGAVFEAPDGEAIRRFRAELEAAGRFVRVRPARGRAVRAACGQLAIRRSALVNGPPLVP